MVNGMFYKINCVRGSIKIAALQKDKLLLTRTTCEFALRFPGMNSFYFLFVPDQTQNGFRNALRFADMDSIRIVIPG